MSREKGGEFSLKGGLARQENEKRKNPQRKMDKCDREDGNL